MDANETAWALKALLDWQAELGADAAIAETPQDRYGEVAAAPVPSVGAMSGRVAAPGEENQAGPAVVDREASPKRLCPPPTTP